MAAVRRTPTGRAGGHGPGTQLPGLGQFFISGRLRCQPANDNASRQRGSAARGVAGVIALTLGVLVLALLALA